jgi:ketosteroid isomerase-like protein
MSYEALEQYSDQLDKELADESTEKAVDNSIDTIEDNYTVTGDEEIELEAPELPEGYKPAADSNTDPEGDEDDIELDYSLVNTYIKEKEKAMGLEFEGKDKIWSKDEVKNAYKEKYGDKAKEAFEQDYDKKKTEYIEEIRKASDRNLLMFNLFGDESSVDARMTNFAYESPGLLGGGVSSGSGVYGQSRSVREACVDSMNMLDENGNVIPIPEDDWADMANNPKYTNSEGKKIVSFTYPGLSPEYEGEGFMVPVYEGERPQGEVASIYALKGWWISDIGMETSTGSMLPKAIARSTVNSVMDLAIGVVGIGNSISIWMDKDNDNKFIRDTRDSMTAISMLKVGKSDYNNEHMFTVSNGLDLVGQIVVQLLTGAAAGKSAAALSKAMISRKAVSSTKNITKLQSMLKTAVSKGDKAAAMRLRTAIREANTNAGKAALRMNKIANLQQSAASTVTMGLMFANDTRDEALNAGFSEDAAAGLFFASIAALSAANSLSNVIINEQSASALRLIVKDVAKKYTAIATPAAKAGDKKAIASLAKKMSEYANKQVDNLNRAMMGTKAHQMGAAAAVESVQEVTEELTLDIVKTSANIIASIGVPKTEKAPHMLDFTDKKYWEEAHIKYGMAALGGALGGPIARFALGSGHTDVLSMNEDEHTRIQQIILSGEEGIHMYRDRLKKNRDKGLLGSLDLSYERGEDGEFKLLSEMSKEDREKTMSIGEANYKLKVQQLNHYVSLLSGYGKTYQDFKKEHGKLASILTDDSTVMSNARRKAEELAQLYDKFSVEKLEAADNIAAQEDTEEDTSTRSSSTDEANQKKRTTEDNTSVTSNEKGVSEDIDNSYTEKERQFAALTGATLGDAREILNTEQELKDIVTGKTAERDLIRSVIAANSEEFGILSEDKNELFAEVDELLDSIVDADVRSDSEYKQKRADFIKRKQEIKNKIDSITTAEELLEFADGFEDGSNGLYMDSEEFRKFESKVNDLLSDSLLEKDVKAIIDKAKESLDIATEEELDDLFFSLNDEGAELVLDHSGFQTDGEKSQALIKSYLKFVEDNIESLYKFASSEFVLDAEKNGESGALSLLKAFDSKDQKDFLDFLKANLSIDAIYRDGDHAGIDSISRLYKTYVKYGTPDSKLLSYESDGTTNINKSIDALSKLARNRSDQTADSVPDGPDLLTKMFDVNSDGTISSSTEGIDEHLNKLRRTITSDGLFSDIEEAKRGKAVAELRAAQMKLLFRLGDPLNKGKISDLGVTEVIRAMGTIALLKELNSKVLSEREYNDSLVASKYNKFSKFVSGWIFDPEAFINLMNKDENTLTDNESKRRDEMIIRINVIKDYHSDLTESSERGKSIIEAYQDLIDMGEASTDELKVAERYKGSAFARMGEISSNAHKLAVDNNLTEIALQAAKVSGMAAVDSKTDGELEALFMEFTKLAEMFYSLDDNIKSNIIKEDKFTNNDITAMMLSSITDFYKNFHGVMNVLKAELGDKAVIPTIDQEMVCFQAYAFMTRGHNSPLEDAVKEISHIDKFAGAENFMVIPGGYGTGKTQVVLGIAAKVAQLKLQSTGGTNTKTVLSADTIDQVNNLVKIGSSHKIVTKDVLTGKELVELMKNPGSMLDDVGIIMFDEASYLDMYNSADPDNQSSISIIAKAIAKINADRKTRNIPPLSFIALGDSSQGGWRTDMTTVSGNNPPSEVTAGNPVANNLLTNTKSFVFSSSKLTTSFRSYVGEIDSFTKKLRNASTSIDILKGSTRKPIRTIHGKLKDGKLGGCEIVSDEESLYTQELADELRTRLEEDEDFTVLIVDESIENLEQIEVFKDLAKEYSSRIIIKRSTDVERMKLRDVRSAQGLEASYVIINTPGEVGGWLPDTGQLNEKMHRYNLLSMLVGRARYYAKIRLDTNVDITSSESDTQIPQVESSIAKFMGEWGNLRLKILGNQTNGSATEVKVSSPKITYSEGETVTEYDAEGNVIGKATVTSVNDGVVVFTREDGSTVEFDVKSDSSVGDKFIRSGFEPTTKPNPTPKTSEDAATNRRNKYNRFTVDEFGEDIFFEGKPGKVMDVSADKIKIKITSSNTIVEVDRENLGKTLTSNTIEDQYELELKENVKGFNPVSTSSPSGVISVGQDGETDDNSIWEDLVSDIKDELALELEEANIQDIAMAIDEAIQDLEDIEAINKLSGLKDRLFSIIEAGDPDDSYDPEQSKLIETVFPSEADPDADKDAKASMTEMEDNGVVAVYTEVVHTNKSDVDSAFSSSSRFCNNFFGEDAFGKDEIKFHSNRAVGSSAEGKAAMADYTYSFISAEFSGGSAIAHDIIATHKATGKKFIVGMISFTKLREDSELKKLLLEREAELRTQASEYRKGKEVSNKDVFKAQKGKTVGKQKLLLMETDITKGVQNQEIIIGNAQGELVTNNEYAKKLLLDAIANGTINSVNSTEVKSATLVPDKSNKVKVFESKTELHGSINNETLNEYASGDSKVLDTIGNTGKSVIKVGDSFVVKVLLDNRNVYFVTTNGLTFEPIYGFDKDGTPLVDPRGSVLNRDSELADTKQALEEAGLDIADIDHAVIEDLEPIRDVMSEDLGYNLRVIDSYKSMSMKVKLASAKNSKLSVKTFKDVRISLNELKSLLMSRSDMMSMSKPLVLRQSLTGEMTAGTPFVFYSFNKKYDLNNDEVVKSLEETFKKSMEETGDPKMDIVNQMRDGVGIILLDNPSYSLEQLFDRFTAADTKENKSLNRYAIPSGSEASARLLAFFSELSRELVTPEFVKNYDETEHTRLNKLLEANSKDGDPVTVIDTSKMDEFKKILMGNDTSPEARIAFLSLIYSMTKDVNMGNYISDLDELLHLEVADKLYPGADDSYFAGRSDNKLQLNEKGFPVVAGMMNSPIVFIPSSYAEGHVEGSYEPMRFNLEAFFNLIRDMHLPDGVATEMLRLFDLAMQDYTLPQTLGLGIKVPPAVSSSNKTQLWSVFPDNSSIGDDLTTSVKDIRTPSVLIDFDNLKKSLAKPEPSEKKVESHKFSNEDLNEAIDTLKTALDSLLDNLRAFKSTNTNAVNKRLLADVEALKTLGNDLKKKLVEKGGKASMLDPAINKVIESYRAQSRTIKPVTEYSLDQVRSGDIQQIDEVTLETIIAKNPDADIEGLLDLISSFSWAVDEGSLKDLIASIDTILDSLDAESKFFLEGYIKPIINSFSGKHATMGSKKEIDNIIELDEDGVISVPRISQQEVETLLNDLTAFQINPADKTLILQAWLSADDAVKKKLEPYLYYNVSDTNNPIVIATELFTAITSDYPVNINVMQSVKTLLEEYPEIYKQLMDSDEVKANLAKDKTALINNVVSGFESDIEYSLSSIEDTNEKLQNLGALSKVVEGMQGMLNDNVINSLITMIEKAKESVAKARGVGNPREITPLIESDPEYDSLSKEDKDRMSKLLTKVEDSVGDQIGALIRLMKNESLPEDKHVIRQQMKLFSTKLVRMAGSANMDIAEKISLMMSNRTRKNNC